MARVRTPEELYQEMCAIVQAPGYTKLSSYQDDLHKIDRGIIERTWHPSASYLWVVRGMGTHLAPVGLRNRDYIELNAALCLEPSADIFYVDAQLGVHPISRARFDEIIKQSSRYRYTPSIEDPVFYKGPEILASVIGIEVHTIEPGCQSVARLTLEAESLQFEDLIAIDRLASHTMTNRSSQKIHTINGLEFEPLLARMKACVLQNLQDGFPHSDVYIEGQQILDGSDDGQSNPARIRESMNS